MKIEISISDFLKIVKDKDAFIDDYDEKIQIGWWHYYKINGKKVILVYERRGDYYAFDEMLGICDSLNIKVKVDN